MGVIFLIQLNFIKPHISGKNNTAADVRMVTADYRKENSSLYHMEIDPEEKLVLKIREDVEIRLNEVKVQSAGSLQSTPGTLTPWSSGKSAVRQKLLNRKV